jgi:hypothetical protein
MKGISEGYRQNPNDGKSLQRSRETGKHPKSNPLNLSPLAGTIWSGGKKVKRSFPAMIPFFQTPEH